MGAQLVQVPTSLPKVILVTRMESLKLPRKQLQQKRGELGRVDLMELISAGKEDRAHPTDKGDWEYGGRAKLTLKSP